MYCTVIFLMWFRFHSYISLPRQILYSSLLSSSPHTILSRTTPLKRPHFLFRFVSKWTLNLRTYLRQCQNIPCFLLYYIYKSCKCTSYHSDPIKFTNKLAFISDDSRNTLNCRSHCCHASPSTHNSDGGRCTFILTIAFCTAFLFFTRYFSFLFGNATIIS